MSVATPNTPNDIAACAWCHATNRPLTRDSDGDLVCADERLCGTATTSARKPPVAVTVTPAPTVAAATPSELADEAEAAALALLVTIRRSRRVGHRLTREVVEAQDRSRGAALAYHRATVGRAGR